MSRFILPLFLMLFLSACGSYQQPNYQLTADGLKSLHANYAPVKDGRIEYYRLGVGSPIILLPGYVTDISSWNRSFLAALAKHHELIILNNRNVGGSVVHSTQYEAKYLAEDTYQLIQYLELKKPTILGISMGGMLAQQLAVLHSDQIGPVILINTAIAGQQAYAVAVELFFPASWKYPWLMRLPPIVFNLLIIKPSNQKRLLHNNDNWCSTGCKMIRREKK
jgi:pimeloyl-ACP methyl ester carboxylesterase